MLLTPRRRLLALLALVCSLPIVALVVTYSQWPIASIAPRPDRLSPFASHLAPHALSSPITSSSPITTMSVTSTVNSKISGSHVVVFSKSYCPYCRNAKQLLKSLDVEADIYELDQMDEGADWQNYLAEKTGQRTVPNIFIGGQHVGGSSDLEAKHKSGELKKLLSQA
ncbi:glutaredoxin [Sporobolomyces koalae]|uniref:glutaredoxin n=1 Tax=Sporobolomyces koalae TaxID=500713 RepID=UPI00316D1D4D